MASNQQTPVLKRKNNCTSWVWSYIENQNQKTFCKICSSFINWNQNGSSQLVWHLNSTHKIYKSSNQNSATNISNQNDLNAQTEDEVSDQMNSKKKKMINDSLVNYLVSSNLPMSTVNNDSFKKFIKILSLEYSLPSRGFLTYNLIPEPKQVKI